jgi:hypothetical protein
MILRRLLTLILSAGILVGLTGTCTQLAPGFYVATNGLDTNPGTLASPFLTLTAARAAMAGSSTKITYVRGGTYTPALISACEGSANTCLLDLESADAGETFQYYPPDGYGSANITGGSNAVGNGAFWCIDLHANNVTINGLHLHDCQYAMVRVTGGSNTGMTIINNELDHTYVFATVGSGAISCYGCANAVTSHNYIHDVAQSGITFGNVNGTISNWVADSNFIQTACTGIADCGALYMVDGVTGFVQTATGTKWTNNYIHDGNMNAGLGSNSGQAFYTDDCVSDVLISGNVVNGRNGSNTANIVHGGKSVRLTNNIIDLGSGGQKIGAFQTSSANITCPDASMSGNTVQHNIIIGTNGGGGYTLLSGSPPTAPSITTNDYFAYAGGAISSGGNYSDSSPSAQDPQLNCWSYSIAGGSLVLSAPISFAPLVGGWGPPGFAIPKTGTVPSSPHAC